MNNLQETLLFPFQDAEARKQFLLACLVALAAFIIPILPMLLLAGYSAKIMRQIIEERKKPSMPEWQGSDWSEMLMDGLRIYGAQLVLMLPVIIVMVFGFTTILGGSLGLSLSTNENIEALAPAGVLLMIFGMTFIMLFSLLALPYSVIISTVGPHVATTRSFASAFQFKEWWGIFRKGMGQFVLAFVLTMVVSWVLTFIMQIAMITIVLICIVPFIMIPYAAYSVLLNGALYAQAYTVGLDNLKAG